MTTSNTADDCSNSDSELAAADRSTADRIAVDGSTADRSTADGGTADEHAGEQMVAQLASLGGRVRADVPLGPFTTFGIGGPAAVLAEPADLNELLAVVSAATVAGLPVVPIGQGSNLLVADAGVQACVVILGPAFARIEQHPADPCVVRAGGAVKLPVLARQTVALGLAGLEWAVGVPGSVGGGVRMNAGGHGSDMAATLRSASIIRASASPAVVEVPASELRLSYRSSTIGVGDLVVAATFVLKRGTVERGEEELRTIVRWRRENQPGGANCGSVFTNPAGDSSGRLIDRCGLKGHRIGTASISEKHANFIQADPNASSADVSALIVFVQNAVKQRFGIELHPEVQTLGITSLQRSPSLAPRRLPQ